MSQLTSECRAMAADLEQRLARVHRALVENFDVAVFPRAPVQNGDPSGAAARLVGELGCLAEVWRLALRDGGIDGFLGTAVADLEETLFAVREVVRIASGDEAASPTRNDRRIS